MNTPEPQKRFLLVSIIPHTVTELEVLDELLELKSLIGSYGGELADVVTQNREVHDKGMYIGSGKIAEAAQIIQEKKIDIVVLNAVVKPGQLYDMKSTFLRVNPQIEVWDRVDLILEIFSLHAHTAEARLQIELAAMRHMGPRIYGMGMVLSRQAGGIGGRGIGETNTERMKRHWREQMKKAQEKLEKLSDERGRQLERRAKNGLKTVSIIGYTNAGKTTLFNQLTGKKKFAKDVLFATLDSYVGKLYLPELRGEIIVSDTIGFMQHLPTSLITAFRSTLMESIYADLLLFAIDAHDATVEKKITVVEHILREMQINTKRKIYVFTKTDLIDAEQRKLLMEQYRTFTPQFISATTGEGIAELLDNLAKELSAYV